MTPRPRALSANGDRLHLVAADTGAVVRTRCGLRLPGPTTWRLPEGERVPETWEECGNCCRALGTAP